EGFLVADLLGLGDAVDDLALAGGTGDLEVPLVADLERVVVGVVLVGGGRGHRPRGDEQGRDQESGEALHETLPVRWCCRNRGILRGWGAGRNDCGPFRGAGRRGTIRASARAGQRRLRRYAAGGAVAPVRSRSSNTLPRLLSRLFASHAGKCPPRADTFSS